MQSIAFLADLIGLLGVSFILIGYLALQTKKLPLEGFAYSFLNVLGALGILFSLCFHWNTSSFVIEIVWLIISSFGCIRALRHKKNKSKAYSS